MGTTCVADRYTPTPHVAKEDYPEHRVYSPRAHGFGCTRACTCAREHHHSDNVRAVAVAPAGTVWFGTGDGVSALAGSKWYSYPQADGLVFDQVRSVFVDRDGAVWFATFAGASRFDGGPRCHATIK